MKSALKSTGLGRRCVTFWLACMILSMFQGCRTPRPVVLTQPEVPRVLPSQEVTQPLPTPIAPAADLPAVDLGSDRNHPPKIQEIGGLPPWDMSLDEAVQIALHNSDIIREGSGRVLIQPDSIRTSLDPSLLATDPNLSTEAALSAFDTHFQSSFIYNGGGRTVSSGFGTGGGLFGVYSQPETAATFGLGRKLDNGSQVKIGGVGGYDSALASGFYAAYGAEVRHPLRRGGGRTFNQIAGAHAQPGTYRGEWIAQIDADKVDLDLKHAVTEMVREVSQTYWELYFAYRNLDNKLAALDRADDVWRREQQRVAEKVTPADFASMAEQQYFAADAAVKNAIGGTGNHGTGVYAVETKLRALLGLPSCDGRLLRPSAQPLEAEFCFDWHETIALANHQRVELQKQHNQLEKRELELIAAKNQQQAQVDLIGSYRRLADDPTNETALFSEALDGWQVGVEVSRSLSNRREDVAVENALLMLSRERRILNEQQNQVALQLRVAFTELDRAFGVMQSLQKSQRAAQHRHQAESARHAAGTASLQRVIDAQNRVHQAETAFARSLVDYNLAFIKLHHARGTLLDMLGVGSPIAVTIVKRSIAVNARRHSPRLHRPNCVDVLLVPQRVDRV